MILTILGTHEQQFNRLLQAVDSLVLDEPRIYQTGHSTYVPTGECHTFLPYDQLLSLIRQARVIICHAGTGTVMSALAAGKCPVVAPRFKRFGEHVDDHQLELAESLSALGLIVPYIPGDDLAQKIKEVSSRTAQRKIEPDAKLVEHLHQAVRNSALRRSST